MTGLESLPLPELLHLARLGAKFAEQHRGRRPGFLHRELVRVAAGRRLTFDELLCELELDAARRALYGAGPFEKIDRVWGLVTLHDPRKGRRQVAFGTVRNLLTKIRKADRHDLA